ncbi:MAG: hypothetical protein B7Y99_10445 [Caulobacterales bacterium 32-69-10]|nr:MAG: hypothetical protein B7Y99_10445 [Caulobacterales bacterium 32-69-10]
MRPVWIYAALCVPGAILPLSRFLPWAREHGLDLGLFFTELFSTRIGGFFGWDVIVSAVVVLAFIAVENRRAPVRHSWVAVVGLLTVGVSFGLPLFLALRERRAVA